MEREPRQGVLRAFRERGVYRRIARDLARFGIRPSHATTHSTLMAIGMNTAAPMHAIMVAPLMACVLHVDEITFPLNGKKVQVWIFHDPATGNARYAVRDSRGHDIVKEVPGGNWNNTGVRLLEGVQILPHTALLGPHNCRDPQYGAEPGLRRGRAGMRGAADLQDWHAGIRHEGTAPGAAGSAARARRLISKYRDNPVPGGFVGRIGRAHANLFRLATGQRIPPTNNAAERGLQEIVVRGKIRGQYDQRTP